MRTGSDDSVSAAPRRKARWARWASGGPLRGKGPALLVGLVVVALVITLVAWKRENIFTLDVLTEVVAFTVTDPVLSQWSLGETMLLEDPFAKPAEGRRLEEYALLIIEPGTRVRLQRHGIEQIRVQLTTDAHKSVGRIETPKGNRLDLGDWALLLVEIAGRPLVFPFRGTLTAGDDVAAGVESILLGGTVSVVEEQLLGQTHYIAGGETLDPGDRVRLWRAGGDPGAPQPATVSGFVRAEAQAGFSEPANAFTLVAHGQADYVQVERLGSAGYHIRAPHWARFLHDPLLAAVTAIIALLALMLELLSKCGALVAAASRRDKAPAAEEPATGEKGDITQ